MRQQRRGSIARTVEIGLVVLTFACWGRAMVIAASSETAQTQAERNGRFDERLGDLSKRVDDHEQQIKALMPDVAVLKSDMGEIKWIARGAATGVGAQILMMIFGVPSRRRMGDIEVAVE